MNKDEQWQKAADEIDKTVDRKGTPIDQGIKRMVIVLRLLGFRTENSCEGHLDRGYPFPHLNLESHDRPKYEQRYDDLVIEMGLLENSKFTKDPAKQQEYFSSKEYQAIRQEEDQAEAEVMGEVLDLINDFYDQHERPRDHAISVWSTRVFPEASMKIGTMSAKQKRGFLKSDPN
jgi:hypothetical protein